MKKFSLAITTLVLFAFSLYLAFVQGGNALVAQQKSWHAILAQASANPWVGTGLKGVVANVFSVVMNGLLQITNHSMLGAIVLLALLVELLLLYPSVRIQLKQKKIHIFHRKLVDRFSSGELSVSSTKEELHKLYDVNERIHQRGAWLVVAQIVVFLFTFWGMGLMTKAPALLAGVWSLSNFNLLSSPTGVLLPLFASLLYFFHAVVKIWFKEKEDYISPTQAATAILFAVLGSAVVYHFASLFAVAMTLYFITLITCSTIRYAVVEQHARDWGKIAQQELIGMLREAKPHRNRFEYWSRRWNHLPIVRHINFGLLEEALSMAMGLLLALSFFGAFQKNDPYYASYPTNTIQVTMGEWSSWGR